MITEISNPLRILIDRLNRRLVLTETDRAAIRLLPFKTITMERGAYLVKEGEQVKNCGLLTEGFAFRSKIVGGGGRQITSIYMPGEPLDLHNIFRQVSTHSLQLLTRGTLALIPREAILALAAAHSRIAMAMWADMSAELSVVREWVANIGRRNALIRVAHLLCEFAARLEDAGIRAQAGYLLPMTQDEIADTVGLTPVHLNRMFKKLSDSGLIRQRRGTILILDWPGLRKLGDFHSDYLLKPAIPVTQ